MEVEISDREEGWSNIEYAKKIIPSIWEEADSSHLCRSELKLGIVGALNEQCHVHIIDKNLFLVIFCFNLFSPKTNEYQQTGVMGVGDFNNVGKAFKQAVSEAYSFLDRRPFRRIIGKRLNEKLVTLLPPERA